MGIPAMSVWPTPLVRVVLSSLSVSAPPVLCVGGSVGTPKQPSGKSGQRPELSKSAVFEVWGHRLMIAGGDGRWHLAVDQHASTSAFSTAAEAWAAGVREARDLESHKQDAPEPSAAPVEVSAKGPATGAS
jgi:hypothetical protein